jgi:putative lipoic acid-binding regulatory protein
VKAEPIKQPALTWDVEAADLSVFAAIKRWTRLTQRQEKKWQLSWEIPVDFPVTITGTYSGNFEDAVGELLQGYSKADYRPKVCVYSNNVVRIVRFLGNGTECD